MANLDFWVAEARHALDVLDGYDARFRPRRAPDGSRRLARRAVADAAYRFLVRCHSEGLIPESRLRAACEQLHVGVDAMDVRRG